MSRSNATRWAAGGSNIRGLVSTPAAVHALTARSSRRPTSKHQRTRAEAPPKGVQSAVASFRGFEGKLDRGGEIERCPFACRLSESFRAESIASDNNCPFVNRRFEG